jgi:hypothetical protein
VARLSKAVISFHLPMTSSGVSSLLLGKPYCRKEKKNDGSAQLDNMKASEEERETLTPPVLCHRTLAAHPPETSKISPLVWHSSLER